MATIAIDAGGRFAGYASVFGRRDEAGDVVMPGAFGKSLKRRGAAEVRMLFQHDPKEPIGIWDASSRTGRGCGSRAGWCRAYRAPMRCAG